ncbi:hypothetical protein [Paraburkholderia bannensis]|uniref:hypothetical protein n=1 Tax=Paraburkholderia bannensis TaxID=765414 RepID=UPI002AC330E9|nr:hypothetical protein [Paraburkholderia bannensis]
MFSFLFDVLFARRRRESPRAGWAPGELLALKKKIDEKDEGFDIPAPPSLAQGGTARAATGWDAHAERQQALLVPYEMTLGEFSAVILPVLCRFPFMPAQSSTIPKEEVKLLWRASTDTNPTSTWVDNDAISDAADALHEYHPVVLKACSVLRRNYGILKRAEQSGLKTVQILVDERCGCMEGLDDEERDVGLLLSAYEQGADGAALLPPVDCPCLSLDSPRFCRLHLLVIEPLRVGINPEFTKWMEDRFRELGKAERAERKANRMRGDG